MLTTAPEATAQAQIGLIKVGPRDPVTGWPLFYEDRNGLRLGLCQTPEACFFFPPDPNLPVRFPAFNGDPNANYPDELFYWAMDGAMVGNAGARVLVRCALEAAFATGPVAIDDNVVFTRVRIRVTGLVDGASYRVTHPYGVENFVAGVDGPLPGTINFTDDVGIGAALQFNLALQGNVGPFCTPTGFTSRLPGAFIADINTETTIQGSPLGTNFVRIEGPGVGLVFPANAIGPDVVQLDTFTMQGQIATQLGADITKAYVSKTATSTSVNVWASSATGQNLVATAGGSLPVTMTEKAPTGIYFARIELGAGAARPGSVTVTNTTDFPPTPTTLSPLPDLVNVRSAVFTVGGDLVVNGASTDKVGLANLTAQVDGLAPAALANGSGGTASGSCGIPLGTIPPQTVTVRSAAGGSITVPVEIEGNGTPGGTVTPVVANAGGDQTVPAGANVALSGLGSTGPVATYAWTHDAGALITLAGANTSTPSFTAPTVIGGVDITLTLTVRDAANNASVDTVIVHVQPPVQPQDSVVILDARYIAQKQSWRASGTAALRQGQTITVYLGQVGNTTRRIGTAVVDALGNWALVTAQGSAPGAGVVPTANDTQVWASSSLGGQPAASTFRRQ